MHVGSPGVEAEPLPLCPPLPHQDSALGQHHWDLKMEIAIEFLKSLPLHIY